MCLERDGFPQGEILCGKYRPVRVEWTSNVAKPRTVVGRVGAAVGEVVGGDPVVVCVDVCTEKEKLASVAWQMVNSQVSDS
jgi:hypothetical protein